MINEVELMQQFQKEFPESQARIKRERRIEVLLPAGRLYEFAVRIQKKLNFQHLSAISCVDWIDDGEYELVYHFWSYELNVLVDAKIRIDRENPHFETITDLWQPAKFFERDIHEMFGVVFEGNEDLERYILTEWKGPPPMRKDFVSRDFAHRFYHYKDYEPQWLTEMQQHSSGGQDE
ncbi:MAG TPA: NADH-quinone oxidoreductase subunit C [Sediminispirochaeta sp.]|nr:NADH-quinone oxidoreductase subunit C [Sediminispirochaeta sp.]